MLLSEVEGVGVALSSYSHPQPHSVSMPIYLYIITHTCMHYRFNNSTEIYILKHQNLIITIGVEFTV